MTAKRPNSLAMEATIRARYGRNALSFIATPRERLILFSKRLPCGRMRSLS